MTKKNYYLIVPIRNLYKKNLKKNVVIMDGGLATEIFDKYQIPHEYQKMALKVSIGGMLIPHEAFELTTREMFHFKTSVIKAILNQKAIDKLEMLSYSTLIITDNHFYHADKVKQFYQEIIDNGLAVNYQKALSEILLNNNKKFFLKKKIKKEH